MSPDPVGGRHNNACQNEISNDNLSQLHSFLTILIMAVFVKMKMCFAVYQTNIYMQVLINWVQFLIAVSGVGSSPALATCETSQVLLAGVSSGFSRGSPVFTHLLIGLSHVS